MKLLVSIRGQVSEFDPGEALGIINVGRSPENDIVLADEKACSRKHVTLERTVEGWKLVDQMSANGTEVNGEKVNFAHLNEGDVIRIGTTTITVTALAPTPGARAAAPARPARRAGGSGRNAAVKPAEAAEGVEAPVVNLPRKKPAWVPMVAAAGVVAVLGVGGWFVAGQLGNSAPAQQQVAQDTPTGPRAAELTDDERAVMTLADEAMASAAEPLDKLHTLDRLAERMKGRRGSVALSRVQDYRTQVMQQLDRFVTGHIEDELTALDGEVGTGQYRVALERMTRLEQWLAADPMVTTLGRASKQRMDKSLAAATTANEEFVSNTGRRVLELKDQRRYDEALLSLQDMLSRAALDESALALYKAEEAKLLELKAAGPGTQPATPEVAKKPSVLDKVKETQNRLPGKNPLLPDGARSEEKLVKALHARMVAAAKTGKLTSKDFTYKGQKAVIKGAADDGLNIDVQYFDKKTGEELPYRTKARFSDMEAADMLQLYDRTPELTADEELAMVLYCFNNGFTDEAGQRAFRLYQRKNEWKENIDILIAAKRRMEIPEGGFIEFEGALIAPQEREGIQFQRRLREVLVRFEKNAGAKEKRKQEEAEKAFNEIVAMGERAVGPAIAILDTVRSKEMARAEACTGLMAKDDGKFRALLTELDRRRAFALELIMDEVKYPYPYGPNQAEVQADVDERVAAVREIWNDPTSFTGQTNPEFEAVLERVKVICEKMAQLDPEQKFYLSTPEEDLKYIRTIANKDLDIRNYAPAEDKQRKALIALNREVLESNEKFPSGDGHTDADGRAQVLITNHYRIMFARVALKLNDKLFWAAKHHSRYCVEHNGGQIAHVIEGEPRGAAPGDRMTYEGYPFGGGENIHMNSAGPSAQSSHDSWCHSSGHHRNILHPAWRVLGSGKWQTIWTQCFGGKDEGADNANSKGGQ